MKVATCWLLLWTMGIVCAAQARADETPLTLGVHPFKPPTVLVESFTPLADFLAARLKRPVIIKISKDYETHNNLVGTDALDIAYMGPAPYVQMKERYGAKRLLARQRIGDSPTFHGKIFVRMDSPVQTLADLRDKRIVFGDPLSTMSSIVPRAMLLQAGLPNVQLTRAGMIKDHVNIALAVLAGDYDAGAIKEDVFFAQEKRGLRAIATSPPISDHLFVASNTLDAKTIEILRAALLEVTAHSDGPKILTAIAAGMTGFVPVVDTDYDSLRSILKTLHDHHESP